MIPLKSNLKFNKSYDLIIVTEPTGKREGGWILVMDKQKGKKKKKQKGGGMEKRERDAKVWMDERRERPGGGE